jgi:hypothetical protein
VCDTENISGEKVVRKREKEGRKVKQTYLRELTEESKD